MKSCGLKRTLGLSAYLGVFLSISCSLLYAKDNVGKECQDLKSFLSSSSFKIDCNLNYHHYNSTAPKKYYKKSNSLQSGLKIASFNLLYPGNSRNRYKDYPMLARLINKWDIVGAQELVASMGKEFHHNQILMTSRVSTPKLVRDHYKLPGYLKILKELRKIDPSWALLLSGQAEAAKEEYVKELGGFFYRARKVQPIENEFCHDHFENGSAQALGCLTDFTKETVGKELNSIFSRRPFLASFESGSFDFTLLTTHVIYTSPQDPETKKWILQKAFGVNTYKGLGKGMTGDTYARFSEIKATLKFMDYLWNNFNEEDVILIGDFNIEKKNPFWSNIIGEFEGAKILNTSPTTLTDRKFRYVKGEEVETNGLSKNYDHIVLNPNITHECGNARSFNFLGDNDFSRKLNKKYIVRSSRKKGSIYPIGQSNKNKMNRLIDLYEESLGNKLTIKRHKVIEDTKNIKKYVKGYKTRVFNSQKKDNSFYHLYKEIISDHIPVFMTCSTGQRDDD